MNTNQRKNTNTSSPDSSGIDSSDIKPFAPSEMSAPIQQVYHVMNARIELLLLKHEPDIFPEWKDVVEKAGDGPEKNPHWGLLLAHVAAVLPLVRKEHKTISTPDTRRLLDDWQTERNKSLLIKLVYRGCKKRGEC